jgi:hypothetical protein
VATKELALRFHDEVVAADGEITELAPLLRREMNTAIELGVRFQVDLTAGLNWPDVGAIEILTKRESSSTKRESPLGRAWRIRCGIFAPNERIPIAGGLIMAYKIRERSKLIRL